MTATADFDSDVLGDHAAPSNGHRELPYRMQLELAIDDREVIQALMEQPDGEPRAQFAIEAMKIGILALRHVGGQVSADLIQRESERMIRGMQQTLDGQLRLIHTRMGDALKEYFDPESGRFNDRVRRLCSQDGELSQIMKGFIDGENSQLARTMVSQIGPLMKHLDPQQSEGLLAVLRVSVESQLSQHRDHVLKEFSLDHKEGALSRLVSELTTKHGDLSKDLQKKIDEVVKEFSLNEEGSALKRLVDSVDRAQKRICDEFSLDNEQSALKRFRSELMTVFQAHVDVSAKFQEEVKLALQKLTTTREVEAGTPRHGIKFEDAVLALICRQASELGDIPEHTGSKTGALKGRVVGDVVVELGPESATPGAKIVFEAKERESYSLDKARAEIELARKNRQAEIGVFVYSKRTAPAHLRPITRLGCDIFVVWDAEDPSTDIHLSSALDIARGLCVRQSKLSENATADFHAMEKAINDIEKHAENLDEVKKYADTIKNSSEKILKRVEIDREAMKKQVVYLRDKISELRDIIAKAE